jgi:lysophospholipase L1-like esterase
MTAFAMACRIAVLGDSSSSGIGLGRACYPAKLFRLLQTNTPVEIVNCAVPGITSADASRFFHTELAQVPPDYLIIYLGNNEGAVGGPKGHYNRLKVLITEALFGRPNRRFNPVLSPSRFRFEYAIPARIIAVRPPEFRANLRSIIRSATRLRAQVILVNPIANSRFPCGLGVPNSSYFCYLDDLDRLGGPPDNNPTDPASEALAAGLRQFASGDLALAIKTWERVVSHRNVAGFVARHNLACAQARLDHDGSREALGSLLGEYECYDSTILYNLAHLARDREGHEADRLLAVAVEKDISVYRVRREYRDVISGFAGVRGVQILDLNGVLDPSDFVDYCHPTEEGHEKIARELATLIRPAERAELAAGGSSYRQHLPSPNYVRAPDQTLCDYYCIDWPIPQARIATALAALRLQSGGGPGDAVDEIERCVRNFRHANGDHPIFTANIRVSEAWTPRSHEILSIPENYLHRVMYNYASAFETEATARWFAASAALETVRLSAADYERLILRANDDDLQMELDVRPEYYEAIVRKIIDQLVSADRLYHVVIGERIRGLMTWYTREALRYGTQSRMSMLYPRWEIDRLVEGWIAAAVISIRQGMHREVEPLDEMMTMILRLLEVHERHVRLHHHREAAFSVGAYQRELEGVRGLVRARFRVASDA